MIKIICVGKLKENYLKDAITEYSKRLSKYTNLEIIEIPDESYEDIDKVIKIEGEKIERHLNPNEKVLYAFAAQKNISPIEIFYTNVIVLTNKRILIATKRVLWGYYLVTITPDMFND